MLDKEIELIRDMATPAVQETVTAYTHYMVSASLIWIVFGIALMVSAIVVFNKVREYYGGDILSAGIMGAVLMFSGGLFVAANLSDLMSPKAVAIHQLLKDVRGK